jgi:ribonucleoside-diphosphate reductase alpha chain
MKMENLRLGAQPALQEVSYEQLMKKYGRGESSPEEILDRVARGLARNESDQEKWAVIFRDALEYCILGGRINASAGVDHVQTTWINCFVQPIADSVFEPVDGMPGIMEAARQAAQTMRLGGGVGYDFSPIRPKGAWIAKTKSLASGPISYMEVFNSMCSTVISAGARRGAQMGILRCDHPDIEDFIVCKRVDDPNMPWDRRPFRNFNLSVGVTDALMEAVEADGEFELVHAAEPGPDIKAQGAYRREDGKWVYRKVRARELYDKIIRATYERAEPGVVFLDRINRDNNLRYVETIAATNPCGEQPLPPYGCCDLGHVNLTKFVSQTVWEGTPAFDWEKLEEIVPILVRMLDNVLDLTPWPLPEQQREAQAKRRIGVGITGLGNTLIMLGLKYSSAEGREFARTVMERIRNLAYAASVELAKERGAFPLFDAEKYLEEGTFASRLPSDLKAAIRKFGIRNSHLLSLAPTGTGSLTFGNNCSSGCEPVFDFIQKRRIRQADGSWQEVELVDYAYLVYRGKMGGDTGNLPEYFESVATLKADDHIRMLEVLAPYVDAAISKTVNVPVDYPFEDFKDLYRRAWKAGLKGLTTYRPNDEIGAVLISSSDAKKQEDLDRSDPDRRLKLAAVPETVLKSMRWLDRPHMVDGNPSHTYMVESPEGDFAVQIGHFVNGDVHPFEVWVNGSECPRGLGAIAKTLSADMRSYDRGWLKLKLEALQKCKGEAFEMPMPPDGEIHTMPGAVAAMAWLVTYHCAKIGWFNGESDSTLTSAMMFRKEPKTGTGGTLSWTVDVKNPATGDDLVLFVKELEMPDGTRRPYSVWLAGEYPKTFDGLCKLLSIDMRIVDPAWIGMKLRKLLSYKEPQGDFLAKVPGSEKQQNFPSTVAYIARLLLHRYAQLGILDEEGRVGGSVEPVFAGEAPKYRVAGRECPECGVKAVIKYNGCDKCTNCGYTGSCG